MLRASRLELYVLGRTLSTVMAALALVSVVIMLVDLVELSRTVGARPEVTFAQIVGLMLMKSPAVIVLLLPFAFLFGVMGAFVILNRRSELIALRAAGVSAWRFTMPAVALAFFAGLLSVMVLNPLTANLSARYEQERANIVEGNRPGSQRDVWLRQGDQRSQVVIHADSYDASRGTVKLMGVSLFVYSVRPDGMIGFSRRIEAAEARLLPGLWRLSDVREASPGADTVRSETLSIPSSLDNRAAMERFSSATSVDFWRLPQVIENTEQAGFSALAYRLQLQSLLATPFTFAAIALLAAGFSLRLARLGGLSFMAASGVGLGFGVAFVNSLFLALGRGAVLPTTVSAWVTPIVTLLAGITLLCYTEDG